MHADHLDPTVADLTALHGTNPDRTTISRLLTAFYQSAAASGLPEMERPATTVSTWWPQILASITTGVTNATSEGINRAIKVLVTARPAHGKCGSRQAGDEDHPARAGVVSWCTRVPVVPRRSEVGTPPVPGWAVQPLRAAQDGGAAGPARAVQGLRCGRGCWGLPSAPRWWGPAGAPGVGAGRGPAVRGGSGRRVRDLVDAAQYGDAGESVQ